MKIMIRAHDLGVKGEENIARALCELDLDGIQFVAYKSIEGVKPEVGSLSTERAMSVAKAVKDVNKEIGLVGAYFNPVHPDEEKARRGKLVFADYLRLASVLGATTVGSETGSYMGDVWGYHEKNRSDEAFEKVISTFSDLADTAEQYGAFVGIEGAFNHVVYSPRRMKEALDRIGRKNVKVIFDLYNFLDISNYKEACGILREGHELFGDNILLYHLKDFTVKDEGLDQCAIGKGILDYESILQSIYTVNPNATLVLEGTVGEDIKYSVKFLRDIIRKIEK